MKKQKTNWWRKLKGWQKSILIGGIIGVGYVSINLIVLSSLNKFVPASLYRNPLLTALLMPFFMVAMIVGDRIPSAYIFIPIIVLIFAIIGALIGFLVGKTWGKNEKTKN